MPRILGGLSFNPQDKLPWQVLLGSRLQTSAIEAWSSQSNCPGSHSRRNTDPAQACGVVPGLFLLIMTLFWVLNILIPPFSSSFSSFFPPSLPSFLSCFCKGGKVSRELVAVPESQTVMSCSVASSQPWPAGDVSGPGGGPLTWTEPRTGGPACVLSIRFPGGQFHASVLR